MKRRIVVLLTLIFILTFKGYAAENQERVIPGASVKGYVVDSKLQSPLEYASVVLYRKSDKAQITGSATNKSGYFQLKGIKPGVYYLKANYIGYHINTIDDIEIKPGMSDIDLGNIPLKQAALILDGVEVVAERPAIEYKIDKKVINVSKQYTAVSGTAVDVLENVPSVTVDLEGNVSLRGSGSFTVLIDGRPTILEPNDALQQIPASTIDNIEIITNPSAKYDPDGISGIINIVTKKGKLQGVNGIVNLNLGLEDKRGGDFLLNYQRAKFKAFFGADYNKRAYPGTAREESRTFKENITSFIHSSGDSRWERNGWGLRGGAELFLSTRDILNFGFRYGKRDMERRTEVDFDEWTEPGDTHNLYLSKNKGDHGHDFYSLNLDYQHDFARKGHKLSGQVVFSRSDGYEESTNELLDMTGLITSGQQSSEEGPSARMRLKLDYSLPLQEKDRFEAGYQNRFNRSDEITKMHDYNSALGEYEFRPEYSHTIEYDRDIHSLYAIYSGQFGRLGYQSGIRGEYTYRSIELVGEDERFAIDRWDYFPTLHLSYQFPGRKQLMTSYSRRIDRPRGWHLEPFETWSNAYNIRKGNPALKPEYIDSYELGYQTSFGKNLFSTEAYYRVTHNKVERVRSVYDYNITLHSIENVGTDYAFGAELMLNLDLFKWWNANYMGNLYNYRIEGELYGEPFSRESFNWSLRLNNTIKLGNSTRIQVTGIYNNPTVSSQSRREGFFVTNVGIKQDFLNKILSATLEVRDLFRTSKYEFTSEGKDFYTYSHFTRESPMVMLNISYNFNNYKPDQKPDRDQLDMEEAEEF